MPNPPTTGEKTFRGVAVSPGVRQGRVVVLGQSLTAGGPQHVAEAEVAAEIKLFEQALIATRQQIQEVQRRILDKMGAAEAQIFDMHLLVLDDPVVNDEVLRLIQSEKVSAAHAYQTIAERYATSLAAVEDEYLRERATDMRDVAGRVLSQLLGRGDEGDLRQLLKDPCIVVAHDLAPSQTAQLEHDKVLGFATDVGSRTSHTAIMARSMKIPAVVGLKTITSSLANGDYVLLDGVNGLIIVNPTDQTLFQYGEIASRQKSLDQRLHENLGKSTITLDGHRITLSGNIENTDDVSAVLESGAEGVGLFRTEYLFINHETSPTEEEQFTSYATVAAALKPAPVVIRTLDLGGDKFRAHTDVPQEMNPSLGWRAIRYCLEEQDLFRTQLRAILRASVHGNVKMMYPMISGLGELTQANALLEECKAALRKTGTPFDEKIEVGIMVETPSAALIANTLARYAKFFSLGTNDLIQYSLAMDRTNEKIAHLYEPTHPAIVRLIKMTVDAAHQNGNWVGVCGEMAGDPVLVPLLLGLGVDELSAAPSMIPQIKYLIRRLKITEARELAAFALQSESGSEILARCGAAVQAAAPELFPEARP